MTSQPRSAVSLAAEARLLQCKGARDLEDVKGLAHLLARHGFHPADVKSANPPSVVSDIGGLVERNHTSLESQLPTLPRSIHTVHALAIALVSEEYPTPPFRIVPQWTVWKGGHVWVTIGAFTLPDERAEASYRRFGHAMYGLTGLLYPQVQPARAFVTNPYGHPGSHCGHSLFARERARDAGSAAALFRRSAGPVEWTRVRPPSGACPLRSLALRPLPVQLWS